MACFKIIFMVCILWVAVPSSWCAPRPANPETNKKVDKTMEAQLKAFDFKLKTLARRTRRRYNIEEYLAGTEDTLRRSLHERLIQTWKHRNTNLDKYYQKK